METIWLKTIYVLFFIELGSQRVHLAGWTANPNATWVAPQARQLVWYLKDDPHDMAYLIHDNDKNFSSSFDTVFYSEGIKIVDTPFRAPRTDAFAERWVHSIHEEYLDHILILNESHKCRVLKEFVEYYNHARPHQGIDQRFPISGPIRAPKGPFVDEMSWEPLSTITPGSLQLWYML